MKFLGNPWMVGLLGLGAVAVVVTQVVHPGPRMKLPVPLSHYTPVTVNSPPLTPSNGEAGPTPVPALSIDMDYLRNHFSGWLSVTQRDPFLEAKAAPTISTNALLRQLSQLKLKAIWRQDGVGIAAINQGVYREGSEIVGGKVQRIEDNGVWLEYAGQKEFLVFESDQIRISTNAPPPAAATP